MLRLLALLLLAAPSLAAQTAPEPPPDERRPPLFLLEDDDSRVYLLGSIHALPADALPLPPALEAAYADAEVVAFEADLDSLEILAPVLLQAAMDEETLADLLDDDQKARVAAYTAALGLPAAALDSFEPWMASTTLTILALQRAGLADESVDAYFTARAREDGKARVAFESGLFQIALLDDLPTADQVHLLESGLAGGPDSTAATMREVVALWSAGEDEALAALMARSMDGSEHLHEVMLTRRNAAWIPQIEALLAREGEDALVVVGAGHLVGAGSVVELLRAAGHTVTRQ